jgi:LAO/AO transport system kinase
MLAGAGDELQGIKRGIMEMADALVINKADGSNYDKATMAAAQYQSALHLFPMPESAWPVKTQMCSATENTGISEVWQNMEDYFKFIKQSGFLEQKRKTQAQNWLNELIKLGLIEHFYQNKELKSKLHEAEEKVKKGETNAHLAALELLSNYFNSL